jgi:hypothetical protein
VTNIRIWVWAKHTSRSCQTTALFVPHRRQQQNPLAPSLRAGRPEALQKLPVTVCSRCAIRVDRHPRQRSSTPCVKALAGFMRSMPCRGEEFIFIGPAVASASRPYTPRSTVPVLFLASFAAVPRRAMDRAAPPVAQMVSSCANPDQVPLPQPSPTLTRPPCAQASAI